MKPVQRLFSVLATIFLLCLFAFLVLNFFFLGQQQVVSGSMEPALQHGDYIIYRKLSFRANTWPSGQVGPLPFRRGSIILFQLENTRETLIKRVIGLPGDVVEFKPGGILVNGKPLTEPYVQSHPVYQPRVMLVQEGHVLVLGDNRPVSRDSRQFGPVSLPEIKGKVLLIYWPFKRVHWL